jgi:hypothetical protein
VILHALPVDPGEAAWTRFLDAEESEPGSSMRSSAPAPGTSPLGSGPRRAWRGSRRRPSRSRTARRPSGSSGSMGG